MIKPLFGVAVAAVAFTASSASAQLFSEDWDDGLGAGRWSAPITALECAACGFDGNVDYAFDYSSIGAPSAPGSAGGTTTGIMMETNTTVNRDINGNAVFQGEGVGVVPTGFNLPAGDFILTSDVYMFWNGGGGSTEYAGLGAFSGGTATPVRFNIDNGDGLAWQVDTDGDAGDDMYRYEGPPNNVETPLGGYEAIPDGSIPGVVTGPSRVGPFNQWIELKIKSIAGIVEFSMNGYVIDTFDNTGGTFNGGTVLLNQSDPFDSVNADDIFGFSNVTVFDNVKVVVPEPASIALLSLGGLAMLRRR
jgi:PEP-CTERM motif